MEVFVPISGIFFLLLGAVVPTIVSGQAWRMKKRRAVDQRLKSPGSCEKSSKGIFVGKRVSTLKRMLKKVGAFLKDTPPEACGTVCGCRGTNKLGHSIKKKKIVLVYWVGFECPIRLLGGIQACHKQLCKF